MKNRTLYLAASILWLFVTAGWTVAIGVEIYTGVTPVLLTGLQILTVIVSSAASAVNFFRYKRYNGKISSNDPEPKEKENTP
mgnify:CR=1 FL=1